MRYSSSPIQSDVRSCQSDVRYSYAHKFVMCGDVRFSGTPVHQWWPLISHVSST